MVGKSLITVRNAHPTRLHHLKNFYVGCAPRTVSIYCN
jgi:hypothetical protein